MFFLIEHNRTTKQTSWREYTDYHLAQNDALFKERQFFQQNRDEMEVVIFEADSIDDLKRTHSRYFVSFVKEANDKDALLAAGMIGLALDLLQ